jgi:hypothetical protein
MCGMLRVRIDILFVVFSLGCDVSAVTLLSTITSVLCLISVHFRIISVLGGDLVGGMVPVL